MEIVPLSLFANTFRLALLLSSVALHFLVDRSKFKIFKFLHNLAFSFYKFCHQFLPSFILSVIPNEADLPINYYRKLITGQNFDDNDDNDGYYGAVVSSRSEIERGLIQVLCLMNETPMSSRKYNYVRKLGEMLIHENLEDGNGGLVEINCSALSMGFSRTLKELESAMMNEQRDRFKEIIDKGIPIIFNRIVNNIFYYFGVLVSFWKSAMEDPAAKSQKTAEKFAAELLWLAEEMANCNCGLEAVRKWASASNLASLALKIDPQVQASIIKISVFLLRQARELEIMMMENGGSSSIRVVDIEEMKVKMMILWIPVLCGGNMENDMPILSVSERKEIEKVLKDIINSLKKNEHREKVLAHWLFHYTGSPFSDWPNLHDCYTAWYAASRKKLLIN